MTRTPAQEAALIANRERAVGDPAVLAHQLEELTKVASERGYYQAVTILRMHYRAAKLDCSLDAIRRGEL